MEGKNNLKELHSLAQIMDYEDWRAEISYRLTRDLKRVNNDVILEKLVEKYWLKIGMGL